MLRCMFCSRFLHSINYLMIHIKLNHKSLMHLEIKCNFENCSQTYNNVYLLKRHILCKHIGDNNSLQSKRMKNIAQKKRDVLQSALSNINSIFEEERMNVLDSILPTLNESNEIEMSEFKEKVYKSGLRFITKLYAKTTLNRNMIHEIMKNTLSFYNNICLEYLKNKYKHIDNLCNILQIIENAFDKFKTEHLTFQYLKNINCLIFPLNIKLHSSLTFCQPDRIQKSMICHRTIVVIPIKQMLKQFLEMSNVLSMIFAYIKQCQEDNTVIFSIIQSEFWQSVIKDAEDKIILPLILFFDDIEINNPLGLRKRINKLGAVYVTIPCLPDEYSSRLENIFLIQLHKYIDHKFLGNKIIFNNVIEMITDLEINGIQINVNGAIKTIFFKLCFVAGDNLGLNTILGFPTNFNASYCCRICFASKEERQKQTRENVNMIRTVENYMNHSATNLFGIKENCVFNIIPSFHVTMNISIDLMHDLLEGICRYDVGKILNDLIYKNKMFTLQIFHERIRFFNHIFWGENTMPLLLSDSVQNEVIIISASEMKYLVLNLCVIVGDLVPTNNKVWSLYLLLRQILCIVTLKALNTQTIDLLETLITEYLTLHIKLFPNSLKSKHHNLIHYPRIMRKYGPLKYMSCIRFEAKHKEIKENSKICKTRINPSFTLALRHQLQLCYRFLDNEGLADHISLGAVISKLHLINNYERFKKLLPCDTFKDYDVVKWIILNGVKYYIDAVICVNNNSVNFVFGKVKYIIINTSKSIFFLYNKLITVSYHGHLCAFEIIETQEWGFMSHKDLLDCEIYYAHVTTDKKSYVPIYL